MDQQTRRDFIKKTALAAGALALTPGFTNAQTYFIPGSLDRNLLPEPVFDLHPEWVDFYWKAWELAWDHIKEKANAPQSPYMDEAFSDKVIWIWDTCFMMHFCKYAHGYFPGIESLNNFYEPLHQQVSSPLVIHQADNPPLFAWSEFEYAKLSGNKAHLRALLTEKQYLQKHYQFFDETPQGTKIIGVNKEYQIKKTRYGYMWGGGHSGMDDTPRGDYINGGVLNPFLLWFDAATQQGLAAESISNIAQLIDEKELSKQYQKKYKNLKELVNKYYWNKDDGFYYDVDMNQPEKQYKVKTPAAFWPMLAGFCSKKQAAALAKHAGNPEVFGGEFPWPSVSRNDKHFEPKGKYWNGGIWLPTAYMATKALQRYGYFDVAGRNAFNLVSHMYKTFVKQSPHTIWECYSPTENKPATGKDNIKMVRKDFCGWSALGPISLFIENVIGFHTINAFTNEVHWHLHHNFRHGIKRLKFSNLVADIVAENNRVTVKSTGSFTLIINKKKYTAVAGEQIFELLK